MSVVDAERVLVVPTELFRRLGHFQGFSIDVERYLPDLLDPQHVRYRPRGEVEEDPRFKQLIPYVLFRHDDAALGASVFQYTRGTGQGEERLHQKRSVGVGGHIASTDEGRGCGGDPYREGMRRELDEEVLVETKSTGRCVGLINDDQTDVGRVHLGIVHVVDVETPSVRPREKDIVDAAFLPVERILGELDAYESWSQICMRALFEEPK